MNANMQLKLPAIFRPRDVSKRADETKRELDVARGRHGEAVRNFELTMAATLAVLQERRKQ